jgi:hypothetical protein
MDSVLAAGFDSTLASPIDYCALRGPNPCAILYEERREILANFFNRQQG